MNWQWARLGYGCSLGSSLFCPPTPGKCPSDLALSAGLIENKPSGATRTALLPARGIAGACVKWSVPTSLCRKATVPPPLGPDQCAGALGGGNQGPSAPGWSRQHHSQRDPPFVPSKRLPDWASLELSPSVESCGCGLGPSPVRLG